MRPQFLLAALTALASAACYPAGDGQAPPLDQLYFPTGLALEGKSGEPHPYLYVASSDFDLQYRSSGLISFDLDAIAAAIPHTCSTFEDCKNTPDGQFQRCDRPEELPPGMPPNYAPSYVCVPKDDTQPCGSVGEQSAADRLLHPARCNSFDLHQFPKFIRSTVGIGAFATNVIFAEAPHLMGEEPRSKRLFLPVRGDATLHWVDLDDGLLKCDAESTSDGSCGESHRAGNDPSASYNNIRQPAEPFGIAINEDGDYLAMTNQTSGSVSLYTHDWDSNTGPQLVSISGPLPQAPVAIAAVPEVLDRNTPFAPAPGFLVAYRNAAQVDLLRVRSDRADGSPEGNYDRFTLNYAGSAAITLNSLGYDSRDIVIDDSKRKAACVGLLSKFEKSGSDSDEAKYLECLRANAQPDIYLANRTPSSLLVGAMIANAAAASGSSDLPAFSDSIQLTTGPSRVVLGSVRVPPADPTADGPEDESGHYDLEPRVFVVCFDSTRIFVYDPIRHVVEAVIDTGRGPYAMAVDDQRGLAYVGFFTDSYLGVVSLDQRHPQTYASIIANIGTPTPPRSSK